MTNKPDFIKTDGLIGESFIDLSGLVGVAYVKGEGVFSLEDNFPETSFIMPKNDSHFEVLLENSERKFSLDSNSVLVLPPNTSHKIIGKSNTGKLAIFFPSSKIIKKTSELYDLSREIFSGFRSNPIIMVRTIWLNEIMYRYIFERLNAKNFANIACQFLETEIVKEFYYIYKDFYFSQEKQEKVEGKDIFDLDKLSFDKKSEVVRRAISFVERNLFQEINLDNIAKASGASKSTLLRAFKNDLDTTPYNFIKERRLNEAAIFIKQDLYTVAEIGEILGYSNTSAFISAFKIKFGVTPSRF